MTLSLDPVFHALADNTRREILFILRDGEHATGEIAERFELSRPAISKHLGVLVDANLVRRRKRGRNQLYGLQAGPLKRAHAWLARYRDFWQSSLRALKDHVEEHPQ